MKSYKQFLDEALITFNKKAYPKFGNVVILAGGAGSGKGFVLSNLVGIEGKVFDVDALKKMAMASIKFANKVKKQIGVDITKIDLKNPDNVSLMHQIISQNYKLDKRFKDKTFQGIMEKDPSRKPNLIFDVTLASMTKFYNLTKQVEQLGYDKKHVHIVWVVNDYRVAIRQNLERDRRVPEMILMDTHKGAAVSMKEIISMGSKIKTYMDGDIWLAFNKVMVDSSLEKSEHGGQFIKQAFYIKVKEAGKTAISPDKFEESLYKKIKSYVPEVDTW